MVHSSLFDLDLIPAGRQRHLDVRIDSLTGIAGFRKASFPFLEHGDPVSISGWRCRARGEPEPFVVARAIRPATS